RGLVTHYVLFVIDHAPRTVEIAGITPRCRPRQQVRPTDCDVTSARFPGRPATLHMPRTAARRDLDPDALRVRSDLRFARRPAKPWHGDRTLRLGTFPEPASGEFRIYTVVSRLHALHLTRRAPPVISSVISSVITFASRSLLLRRQHVQSASR